MSHRRSSPPQPTRTTWWLPSTLEIYREADGQLCPLRVHSSKGGTLEQKRVQPSLLPDMMKVCKGSQYTNPAPSTPLQDDRAREVQRKGGHATDFIWKLSSQQQALLAVSIPGFLPLADSAHWGGGVLFCVLHKTQNEGSGLRRSFMERLSG